MTEVLQLKTINKLCIGEGGITYEFHIPSYQRGYRWTEQATKLLDDLFEFYCSKPTQDDIYCLQPIIVRHNASKDTETTFCYDIIDGQQRLTTILLLLEQLPREDDFCFLLSYERGNENRIDAHYKSSAKNAMSEWFSNIRKNKPDISIKMEIVRILLNNTNIIWYELPEDTSSEDCRKVFRNINAGKIPLTVSELTKAMLLNAKLYKKEKSEQLYKASVWDEMARSLENRLFWEFITNHSRNKTPQTKVDYLLLLDWCRTNQVEAAPEQESEVFKHFETLLIGEKEKVEGGVKKVFDMLREHFRVFQDWYETPQYCNYIGYLVRYKDGGLKRLLEIIGAYNDSPRDEFVQWLKDEIKKTLKGIDVSSLHYGQGKDNDHLQNVLLIFAIETANQLKQRFDFKPAGGWSLEHVFAQHSEKIGGKDKEGQEARLEWLQKYLNSKVIESAMRDADNKEHRNALNQLAMDIKLAVDDKKISDEIFTLLFERIGSLVEHYEISTHHISNIALLGKDDNSSLQNDPFYEKRAKIIKMHRSGKHHIPQSTLNVFQKVYSIPFEETDNLSVFRGNLDIWSKQDGEAYLKHIKTELCDFLVEEVVDNVD